MQEKLLKQILGRDESLFAQDVEKNFQELGEKIANSSILVIGAAGSIGAAFVKQLIPYKPSKLHLVDICENNLVEVVRDLRSSNLKPPVDFKTFSIGIGTLEFEAFLKAQGGYDYFVNFAALKHVRSERDPYTLMRMVHTNVFSLKSLLEFSISQSSKKFFSVSSDKAVNPVSLMGTTKNFMEKLMLCFSDKIPCSSSRFANVAFSDGSLLHSFLNRLEKKQPISAPSDVKRYFISHQEAGILCLLSCFLGKNRENFFPKLSMDLDLTSFSEIATLFLESKNLKPFLFSSEEEAKGFEIKNDSKEWPCYFSQSDTTGEKMFEEFFAHGDNVDMERFQNIGVLKEKEINQEDSQNIISSLNSIQEMREKGEWTKEDIVEILENAIPQSQHVEKGKNLDEKM